MASVPAPPPTLTSTAAIAERLAHGFLYVDVRTVEEFAEGHVPGAMNVPWMLGSLEGLRPNPDFDQQLAERVPRARSLVVGCHSGGRARSAALRMQALGYDVVCDGLGFDGARDAFGRIVPGWSRLGLPIERGG